MGEVRRWRLTVLVSHAAWDVHAVHGVHAMYSTSKPGYRSQLRSTPMPINGAQEPAP
jgi:hypothetical protein